jgi:RNA polymerase sigma-70 factor, ECF subfamily
MNDERVDVFVHERPRLVGLAYRLLGSVADAEDVVQEAWIRWSAADQGTIERPAAWLTTVVSHLGLDLLRAQQRARQAYVGPWLPEPVVEPMTADDPEHAAELADSLATTFLVMLERLSAEERLVLLLADVFGEPFPSVAAVLGRSDDACRQMAVRARHKLRSEDAVASTSRREQLAVAAAFAHAVIDGDIDAVRTLLSDNTVLTSDGGADARAARRPIVGADRVARFVVNLNRRRSPDSRVEMVWVNGSPGMVVSINSRPVLVSVVEVADGRVVRQYWTVNPDKLAHVGRRVALR